MLTKIPVPPIFQVTLTPLSNRLLTVEEYGAGVSSLTFVEPGYLHVRIRSLREKGVAQASEARPGSLNRRKAECSITWNR